MIAERHIETLERIPVARLLLLVITISVLHVSLLSRIVIFDTRPNTFLLLGIVGAVWLGARSGAMLGFFAGLFADIFGYGELGVWAMIIGLVGFIVGYSHDQAFSLTRERVPIVLVAGATAVGQIAFLGLDAIVRDVPLPDPIRLLIVLGVTMGMHVVLAIPLRLLVQFSVPLGSRR
jgi:rod shape-determining protein MreD